MAPRWLAPLGALALTAGVILFAHSSTVPPRARPASAPAGEFSAHRARQHLERIAARPHPPGTEAHREVREYLLQSLRELGVTPEVQTVPELYPDDGRSIPMATVHNVVARLEGADPRQAIAVVAHYDSVPGSHGASDDGASVAAMLETLRALKTGPRPRNDVLFVFTDAEELGLVGARAFALKHPLAKKVSIVLNFEARGASGPSLMFQTSTGNRWLISQVASAGVQSLASSLFYEIYRNLPNDTDLTIFLEEGKAGLNFGWIDSYMRYHTRSDDLANLDLDSLQHQGESMLALTRHLSRVELEPRGPEDAIYFNLGSSLVRYPASWAVPLALLALVALVLTLLSASRRGHLRWGRVALGFVALLAVTVGAAVSAHLAWLAVSTVDDGLKLLPQRHAYQSDLFIAGILALTVAGVAGIQGAFLRKLRRGELIAGALCGWLVLSLASSLLLSGVSYLLTWPLLFATLGLWLLCRSPEQTPSPGATLAIAATTVPALLLWVPLVPSLYEALTLSQASMVTALVALWLGLLLPQLLPVPLRIVRAAALPALVLGLVLLTVGVWRERFDVAHPRPSSLAYTVDATRAEAFWASSDIELTPWTSQFLGNAPEQRKLDAYFPTFWRAVHTAPAPMTQLPAPEVRVRGDATAEGTRVLSLNVASRRPASMIQILLPPALPLQGMTVAGNTLDAKLLQRLKENPKGGTIEYWGADAQGVDLELRLPAGTAVKLRVSDTRFGLDEAPGAPSQSRPADLMPAPFGFALTDQVTVSATTEL
ncbi:M20/M25/M40 family metallo-hydrolase [Hyalangium gracile]|uniref:M20/M25/M40 family metallo-hydrolase n=1 Tax=Hyalangium gracile TaxID=394092 RepID=UPI001CCF12A1|nr:M20/M25/M40 family metallo-hydrolase [Hyalangium gracile]